MSHFLVYMISKQEPDLSVLDPYYEGNADEGKDPKWDWFSVGGRWSGAFKLKPGRSGIVGESGVFGNVAPKGTADIARKKDIDWEAMRKECGENAAKTYDKFIEIVGDAINKPHKTWAEMMKDYNREDNKDPKVIEMIRDEYHAQPIPMAIKEWKLRGDDHHFGPLFDFDRLTKMSKEEFIKSEEDGTIVPFAYVDTDGEWHERATMGWFGITYDQKEERGEWIRKFNAMVASIPDEYYFTAVDCHI